MGIFPAMYSPCTGERLLHMLPCPCPCPCPFPFPFFQIVSLISNHNDMEQIQTIYFKGKKIATLWQLYKQKEIPSLSHLCLGYRIYHEKTQALGQMKSPSERKLCKNIKELISNYNGKPTSPLQPLSVF